MRRVLQILSQSDPWLFSLLWYYYGTTISRTNLALYKYTDSSTFKRKINMLLNKISAMLMPLAQTHVPQYIWLETNKPMLYEHKYILSYLRERYSSGKPLLHPIRNEEVSADRITKALWELKQNQPEYHALINYYIKTDLKFASIASAKRHDYGTLSRRTSKAINMITLYAFEPELIPQKENRVLLYPDSE